MSKTSPEKMSVKMQYGILGGERLGRSLRRELRNAGYHITKNQRHASIIIGHSAGCFWLPDPATNQKIVLIDPPYWPERTVKDRARSRMRSNLHFRRFGYSYTRWLKRMIWGGYYSVRDFKRIVKIFRYVGQYDLPEVIKDHQVLLIRNQHDDWLTPELDHLKVINPNIIIKLLPGDHEDWYHNPKPYVDLIQSVYGTGK